MTNMIDCSDLKLISEKLNPYFSLLERKTIFVTGGTGFFGKWLLETISHLNDSEGLGIKATVLSRKPDNFQRNIPHLSSKAYFEFIKGDVRSFEKQNSHYDYIIHAATDVSNNISNHEQDLIRSTILDGTKHIVDFAKRVGCKRLLYTSSGAVYGNQSEDMIHGLTEDYLLNKDKIKKDVYASAKLESEDYLRHHLSCDLIVARCFAFSGPYLPLDGKYAFGNFISNSIKGENIVIKGNGTTVRSYLYAADLSIWLFTMLVKGIDRQTYNVGSNEAISIKDLAHMINDSHSEVQILGKSLEKESIYFPSIDKAKRELDLEIYTSLDESIIKTINFYGVK